jgi:hypothetical protein
MIDLIFDGLGCLRTNSSSAAIFQDGDRELEEVFLGRHRRCRRDFFYSDTDSGEWYESCFILHFSRRHIYPNRKKFSDGVVDSAT